MVVSGFCARYTRHNLVSNLPGWLLARQPPSGWTSPRPTVSRPANGPLQHPTRPQSRVAPLLGLAALRQTTAMGRLEPRCHEAEFGQLRSFAPVVDFRIDTLLKIGGTSDVADSNILNAAPRLQHSATHPFRTTARIPKRLRTPQVDRGQGDRKPATQSPRRSCTSSRSSCSSFKSRLAVRSVSFA